jgi:hypothetical protein
MRFQPDNQKSQHPTMKFIRRLGPGPQPCSAARSCPDILELENGDFAIIGADITEAAKNCLPPTAGCGPHEKIIRIPRALLVGARHDIPASA